MCGQGAAQLAMAAKGHAKHLEGEHCAVGQGGEGGRAPWILQVCACVCVASRCILRAALRAQDQSAAARCTGWGLARALGDNPASWVGGRGVQQVAIRSKNSKRRRHRLEILRAGKRGHGATGTGARRRSNPVKPVQTWSNPVRPGQTR